MKFVWLVLAALGCAPSVADVDASASIPKARSTPAVFVLPSGPLRTTREIISDPHVAKLVDAVAALPEVYGKFVGDDPVDPHPGFLAYQRLNAAIDDTQAVALLRHENQIVGGYMIWRITDQDPIGSMRLLYPLLSDERGVSVMPYGCSGTFETIGSLVLDSLAYATVDREVRETFYTDVAHDKTLPPHTRAAAVEKLAVLLSPLAAPLANELVAEHDRVLGFYLFESLRRTHQPIPAWADNAETRALGRAETKRLVRTFRTRKFDSLLDDP